MDEELVESDLPTVGERLKAAREEQGLGLEDIAAQTRIPRRHLESIETGDWGNLPAPTYTVGFAKSYASSVGLDRTEIGDQLREEMGGQRFASSQAEVIEAADPARTMPKSLVIGAVAAVIVIVLLLSWFHGRSLEGGNEPAAKAPAAIAAPVANPAAPARVVPQTASGPVVLAATAPAWIQVTDQGKTLFSGELQPGQTYAVPATATAPMLKAGKPEALRVTVGAATAPQVGPAGKVADHISLLGGDLMKGGAATAIGGASGATAPPAPAPAAGQ